jgi:hypothetical protein
MPLTRAGSLDPRGGRSCALWQRLLGGPASENGRLRQGTEGPSGRRPPPERANVGYAPLNAVARYVIGSGEEGYALSHPRFQAYVADRLRDQIPGRRTSLLDYCAGWAAHRAPYALQYYVRHLADHDRWDDAHRVVAMATDRHAFAETRCEVEDSHAGYLADLAIVWQHADRLAPQHPAAVGRQVRYALITASVRSLTINLTPALLLAAVKSGVRAPHLALEDARQIPDPLQRARALGHLVPHLAESDRDEVAQEAFDALKTVSDDVRRADSGLVGPLPSIQDADLRWQALVEVAPQLPQRLLPAALEMARSIRRGGEAMVRALAAVGACFPEPERTRRLDEALAEARAIQEVGHNLGRTPAFILQARGLASVAPYLTERARTDVVREAMAMVWPPGKYARYQRGRGVDAVSTFLHLLPEPDRTPLAAKVVRLRASGEDGVWDSSLIRVAPYLSPADASDLLRRFEAGDGDPPLTLRAALVASLAERERTAAALSLRERLRSEPPGPESGRALAMVALHLPEGARTSTLEDALAALVTHEDNDADEDADGPSDLERLAPLLPPSLLAAALKAVRALPDARARGRALDALVPHLRPALVREALVVARIIGGVEGAAKNDDGGEPMPPGGRRSPVLEFASPDGSRSSMADMMPGLAGARRARVLRDALRVAREIEAPAQRALALIEVLPHLAARARPNPIRSALAAARAIADPETRADVLIELLPHLIGTTRARAEDDAAHAARAIDDEQDRFAVLTRLGPLTAIPKRQALWSDTLATARKLEGLECVTALCEVMPHLDAPQVQSVFGDALRVARGISYDGERAASLGLLVPWFPEAQRPTAVAEALRTALAIPHTIRRGDALRRIAPALAELAPDAVDPLWREAIHVLATRTRQDLLSDLDAMRLVIRALGGADAEAETRQAIADVGRWYP